MNRPPQGHGQQRPGATWYPGGQDDFYMPEVISPSPQRVMPEVPENMQDNIAQMEYNTHDPRRGQQSPAQYQRAQAQYPERTSSAAQGPPQHNEFHDPSSYAQSATYDSMDHPNFSPFPVLRNPPPNVPPTDEQREANLERARMAVLSTTDPEMQLAWALDALAFVEVAAQNEARLCLTQPPRPQTPQVERQLRVDAMNIVGFLAEQRHPKAEFIKGMWLEFGKFGCPVDRKEAFRSYSRAAEKGYARAEYRIGMQFESSGEPEKAIKHYERGVARADSASYYRLGMMILLGQHGQRQDFNTGLDYIRLAAQSCDQNAPQGAYVYGMLLARELPQVSVPESFLPLDLNLARVNIEKAAYHGFAKAQVKMGAAYELCQLSCDFNPALSLHYNALAARQGEPEAEMAISKWFLCGHEGVFEKNDELAFTYAQRAAQSGLPTAEFALGYFYEVGIFVPVDIKEARSWYAKSAASGNKDASGRIESISRSKTLSRKDHEKVAISRIKSTRYTAHQRGASLEPTPENIQMPDPTRMNLSDSPPSAAPYPDRPHSTRPRPQQGYQLSDTRPSSAFGVNPNLRSNAPSGYGGPPPPGPGSRTPSYGPGGPINYRQSGPGTPVSAPAGPASPQPNNMISPGGTPRLDIGYSAPMPPPGGRRPPPRLDSAPERKPMRHPVSGHSGLPSPGMPSPRLPGSPSFPPRMESRQPSHGSGASTPQAPPSVASSTSSAPQQKPAKPAPPPSKGPKTFEEMGVPSANKDSDCAIDVSANLHNKVTKTQAAKLLRDLHEKKEIEGRISGKQTVYHAIQDPSDSITPEIAAALKLDIERLKSQLSTIKANEKMARAALASLHAKPRVSSLRQDISRLESQNSMIQARLASRHEGDSIQMSSAERETLEKEWGKWQRHVSVRRRICRELWGHCSEVLPEGMTASELWESLGLEGTLQ
ncbi:Chitin synthase activator (Chs3) [Penicillium paradoxum]|uniref:Chitin synthase activator (Chs3) n=1 Tax=Penicillium paradoxum TaxID=176176 RepID=UPI0025498A89|nr:Chitin synthase activator (Chs3) [Penicillium paradoxum]KAJ5780898.1 Chitin synthase activator (Chs3) [Penicillium paradoxum]